MCSGRCGRSRMRTRHWPRLTVWSPELRDELSKNITRSDWEVQIGIHAHKYIYLQVRMRVQSVHEYKSRKSNVLVPAVVQAD